ncbi:RpoD/SigA family RNA polymerase sigma factor (plasmid) [Anabaena sp. FACHB-709]|uniref:Group 2 sigma 70-type sigma factor n=2 Tax=Nostocaceae TaxID=1162 RepID=A0A1Z4KUI1_ANAVA|nr:MULTISPECIES: RpoD/SigA family RNA polymerase sigma factor [Nostocaceae]BAY72649.1 group 2 sigma 70-type sigma factor [Trichormus variabilis NIES-23]MBD2174230.1 RpoD/SigA family RNA polymerase sigma factor [Anabaena cylindrica FACHB-318]MBD2266018.1 RpoD/SigA family RNA polymerase sigma factor [Anabaena sp. FACHB-709]MBD2275449.1 RpoD/SigA family RNA polymerase sigma factor [Nostoc sp. PCC 7120 = FACHB-418]MBD2287330.1 RpoD/SigA family RNA polymerase sigma factor [Anabaena cylindrica FACHB
MPSLSSDLVRIYLQEIGQFPLLTSDQEITYARLVQQMIALQEQQHELTQKLEREPTTLELANFLNKTEAQVNQILELGQRAKQKMITANLRLVVSIAKKYQRRNLEFLDLVQEGAIGLQRGIEKFDPNRGYKLSTYAYWWVTQAITRAIAEKSRTVRLPIHVNEKLNQIKKVQREFFQTLGRRATVAEIAQKLELEPSQIREYLKVASGTISLDLKIGDNKETELSELLASEGVSPDENITHEMLRQDLSDLLASLKPMQREVLILRFGLLDNQEQSLAQIGEKLNLSRERVRQIQQKAMTALRRQQPSIGQYLTS